MSNKINLDKTNGLRQFAVVNIPWTINWEAMEITEEKDKEEFIENFISNIQHKPIYSYNPENPDEGNETMIGTVEEAYKKSIDNIDLFCSMWIVVSPEYDMITTNDNMGKPMGLRLNPVGVCVQFDDKLNKAYTDASKIHAGLATRLRETLDPEFAKMLLEEKEREKEEDEEELDITTPDDIMTGDVNE